MDRGSEHGGTEKSEAKMQSVPVLWEKARGLRASLKHLTLVLEGGREEPRGILSKTAPG